MTRLASGLKSIERMKTSIELMNRAAAFDARRGPHYLGRMTIVSFDIIDISIDSLDDYPPKGPAA
ncbi:hypothetical protein [Reyranella sp.]|uniref:hypothetical protein n=1 Tax=Reyranella sp. TaxID=1929291 RepID=UPI003BA884B5